MISAVSVNVVAIVCMGYVAAESGAAFTNYVNMEKLYTLEDELITLTDVILRQERIIHGDEDTHGIYNVSSTVENVKDIHRQIVSSRNLSSYIVNPVNIYHMTKRLVKDWTKVIATLEDSKSCAKVMRTKVENIADNIPSGSHLKHVIKGVLRLQAIYNISVDDVMSGSFSEFPALSNLSLDDAFEFARVAYETDQYYLSVVWLKVVISLYNDQSAKFKLSNAMNLLSSAYLKLQRPKDALATLDELLKTDPDNVVARRNGKFIIDKIDSGMTDADDVTQQELKSKKDKLLQKCCIPDARMKAIMYKNHYTHPEGIDGLHVEDNTNWQWIPNLQNTLNDFYITERPPIESRLIVRNIGLHGMENPPLGKSEQTRLLGTFIVFLTEPKYGGGDVVFPFLNIKVTPAKGSVLFYERKVHKQATICPVVADTQWVGIYRLYDQFHSDICYKDILRRPTMK